MNKIILAFFSILIFSVSNYAQPLDMNRLLPESSRFYGGTEEYLTGYVTKSVGNFAAPGGEPEFIVSEPFNDRIFIIIGKQKFPQNIDLRESFRIPKITISGYEGSAFGISVAAIGDFNNDGWNDIAIGAPFDGETGSEGRIYILKGSSQPQSIHVSNEEAFALIIEGRPGEQLGHGIGEGAYFNDDSFTDFPIYQTQASNVLDNRSNAYLVYGSNAYPEKIVTPDTIPQNLIWSVTGPDSFETGNEHFGSSFEFVGDLSGDEFPELALSLGVADAPPQARLLILEGGSRLTGNYSYDNIPHKSWQYHLSLFSKVDQHAITTLKGGDFNNDGIHDIAAGFSSATIENSTQPRGAVAIIQSSTTMEPVMNIDRNDLKNTTLLTHWVRNSGLGEVISVYQNNLALGVSNAFSPFSPQEQTGAVYVIQGEQIQPERIHSNLAEISSMIFYGRKDQDLFGHSVDYIGDYNRNGLHDFLIGAPGNIDSASPSAYLNQYRPRFFDPNKDGVLDTKDLLQLGTEWKQENQTSDFTNDDLTNEEDLLQLLLRLMGI